MFSTMLDIAGVAPPAGQAVDGVSLIPLMKQSGGFDH